MNHRSLFRTLARDALANDPRMILLTQLPAWAGNISAETLPVIGVVTPQERVSPDTFDMFERSTLLQVVVKRLGGDELEDELDADADAIEICVCAAIMVAGYRCFPEDLTLALNGDGAERIGTALVNFRVTYHRALDGSS
ncbi:MAG: hypothetical protein Q8K33_24190 [Cypionkella sp.]|uniref:hypothetical protein n=1 Tax=Cypionkella sp. TaxID=2811411 RepID=UPI00272F1B57|nr:hypothetical protein [Cypionkella sp.]MDP1620408.1 hypothetical protein [bacterium]MDP2051924.1 hypothetical protein [Cypionkella sp.]